MSIEILIFSRDREKELLATLRRMSDYALRLCVFHNSQRKLPRESIPNNVTYIHAPGMNYGKRAQIAIDYLESDFCAISSDDDGICESSIKIMNNWLIQNPKYASVGGLSIGAFPYGGRVSASVAYREMNGYFLESEETDKRLETHLVLGVGNKPPRAGLYRLFRRNTMEKILEVFGGCSAISTPYVYEVCAEIVSAWAGPTKYINKLYWIRNWHTEMISRSDWNRKLSFHEWWTAPQYGAEREIFLGMICDKLEINVTYLKELISEYDARWQSFFQTNSPTSLRQYPRIVRVMGQRIKRDLFPNSAPMRIERLLSEEFSFLSLDERQEVCKVTQEMFFESRNQ